MRAVLTAIEPYLGALKIAAVLLAAVLAAWWWHAFKAEQQDVGYQRAAGEYAVLLAAAKDRVRQVENEWNLKWRKATDDRAETEKQLVAARADALAADQRMRRAADDFRQRLSAASVAAAHAAAATAADLLATCSGRYRELAAAADGHVADAAQCHAAWPGHVK